MHFPTDRTAHIQLWTTADHWLEWKIAQTANASVLPELRPTLLTQTYEGIKHTQLNDPLTERIAQIGKSAGFLG